MFSKTFSWITVLYGPDICSTTNQYIYVYKMLNRIKDTIGYISRKIMIKWRCWL